MQSWGAMILDEDEAPIFATDVHRSTFENASPYLVGMAEFSRRFGCSERRACLMDALDRELRLLRGNAIEVVAVLVGGSFLDLSKASPKDLDCAVFYQAPDGLAAVDLKAVHGRLISSGVDARLFPVDVSPLFTLKVAIFFSNLYGAARDRRDPHRGCFLVTLGETSDAL